MDIEKQISMIIEKMCELEQRIEKLEGKRK